MNSPSNNHDRLLIFDIQRFCVHDGPGIRTVVFFKGCPLRCKWCQNPESIHAKAEMAFYSDRCAGCMVCSKVCPNDAIQPGPKRINRSKCKICGTCAIACPNEALRIIGFWISPQELLNRIEADKSYYDSSGGGVTLSGGEPLLQPEAVAQFLSLCRERQINTIIETCGAVPWESYSKLMPYTDFFFFDLKASGEALHSELTGNAGNLIAENAKRLVDSGAEVQFRMPIVPGFNDSADSLEGAARFLQKLGHSSITLLRYHAGGEAKIDRIDSNQNKLGLNSKEASKALDSAAELFKKMNIEVFREDGGFKKSQSGNEEIFSPRVWRLRKTVQSSNPSICTERALLVTEYFKTLTNHEEPMIVQKANALRHILRTRQAKIYEDELLVGCFSSKRVGGSIFPELHGLALLEDLFTFDKRKVNPLQISKKDKFILAARVFPFWLNKFLAFKAFPTVKALRFAADQMSSKRYIINETGGISHFVPDYEKLLRLGTSGIVEEARKLSRLTNNRDQKNFYLAIEIACRGLEELAGSYVLCARDPAVREISEKRRAELENIAQTCERAPRFPASTLQEAFQSILFAQIALNLESLDNSVSPGRLDQILYPFYKADIKAGRIDNQTARELVGCYTVKMSEIVPIFSRRITRIHGGMFNGQVAVVGGLDKSGKDAANELTWMFLEAMDLLRMRQPNYHARIHKNSPKPYLNRLAAMLRDGSGAPSLMNDDVVVPMLIHRGTNREDALDYSPVGCVEPVVCGATFGSTDAALMNLALCLEWALGLKQGGAKTFHPNECKFVEDIIKLFKIQVSHLVKMLINDLQAIEKANALFHPTPLTSMFLKGCVESGVDANSGGAKYNSSGIQGVGIADVADSIAAIEEVVFKDHICDIRTLIDALKNDFKGYDYLRGHLLRAPKYGNDDPKADRYANLVMEIFANELSNYMNTRGGRYLAGFYSVTAHKAFGETTGALPSGRYAGRTLASGLSPANGCDRYGPTAALNSAGSLDLVNLARNGINMNLKIDRSSLEGASGVNALAGLIQGYFAKGGMQVQINVLDPAVLLEAMKDPNSHPWLLVRVSGYSAYFNDLSPGMKQEMIERTFYKG